MNLQHLTNMNRQFASSFKTAACVTLAGLASALTLAAAAPVVTSLGSLTDALAAPARVATDSAGRIYTTDPRAGQVVINDAFGRLVAVKGGLGAPLGIAVSATGTIYVGDQDTGSVSLYDSQWNALGKLGAGDGEFLSPSYVALAPDGSVLVTDSPANKVKVYQAGAFVRAIGTKGSGNGQFKFPAGVAVSTAGEIFVVDQINDRVEVFDASGVYQRAFTLRPTGVTGLSGRAQGLALDTQGRVYVADTFQGTVKVFAANGTYLAKLGGLGEVAGKLTSPAGVAIDAQGRLFVASTENARVEIFGLDCFTGLTATPDNQVVAIGAPATFTASVGCAGALTYQWQKDGVDIPNATTASLTLAAVAAGDAGDYTVVVTGTGGPMTSPAAKLVVAGLPVIVQGPVSQTVNEGGAATFTVQATGEGLAYQWSFKGNPIVGATRTSLALTGILPSAQGTYTVAVTSPAGTVNASATLSIVEPTVVTVQPVGLTIAEWDDASFTGAAAGTPPIAYQWYRDGTILTGKTSPTLVLTDLSPAANGNYYFVAANAAGSSTSQVAVLNVLPDTVAPMALKADGGTATNRTIAVTFSKALDTFSAQTLGNYELQGPGGLTITSATLSNGTNLVLGLSGTRTPGANYTLVVRDVTDSAYQHNVITPNPTSLPVASYVELIGINSTSWKYLQVTNNVMDSQPWKTIPYDDSSWSNGFGIFYGNRTNSPWQPNPNPNVTLPFSLSTSDANRTKVYTILNVFTNAGNLIQEFTYYFRTAFVFPGTTNGATLYLRSIVDDGAVFYLNGKELYRTRMTTGTTPTYTNLASSSGSQSWSPAFSSAPTIMPMTNLVTGTNYMAVELHQRTTTDTDITLGVLLEASILQYPVARASLPPSLSLRRQAAGDLILEWAASGWALESSPTLDGPWTPVGAASPVVLPGAATEASQAQYFRLRQPE